MTMLEGRRIATFEEFLDWLQLPENAAKRFELADGEIVEVAPSRKKNTIIGMRIGYYLSAFVLPNGLGVVTGSDAGYKISARGYRQPDVGFVALARVGDLDGLYFEGAPDLAVEVVSEDEDVIRKAREYLSAGARKVWAVYPDDRLVYEVTFSHEGKLQIEEFRPDDVLEGGDVLPGFSLRVSDIFPKESE